MNDGRWRRYMIAPLVEGRRKSGKHTSLWKERNLKKEGTEEEGKLLLKAIVQHLLSRHTQIPSKY